MMKRYTNIQIPFFFFFSKAQDLTRIADLNSANRRQKQRERKIGTITEPVTSKLLKTSSNVFRSNTSKQSDNNRLSECDKNRYQPKKSKNCVVNSGTTTPADTRQVNKVCL